MKTIDKVKEERQVPEELKSKVKDFGKVNRQILKCLKDNPKTIPEIAKETDLELQLVTYHLMTLMKYGKIEAGEVDDMDEYYYYKLK